MFRTVASSFDFVPEVLVTSVSVTDRLAVKPVAIVYVTDAAVCKKS